MSTLDVKELMAYITKSNINTEYPSDMDIKVSGGLTVLLCM